MARPSKEQLDRARISNNVNKHLKEHYKQYKFILHTERQQHIIDYLNSKENKQQYILNLILNDMNKE